MSLLERFVSVDEFWQQFAPCGSGNSWRPATCAANAQRSCIPVSS